jgi:hypothetical protein
MGCSSWLASVMNRRIRSSDRAMHEDKRRATRATLRRVLTGGTVANRLVIPAGERQRNCRLSLACRLTSL